MRQLWREKEDYVSYAREAEVEMGLDHRLSMTLGDRTVQNLAGALKLFLDPGKIGFYDRVLHELSASTKGGTEPLFTILA